MPNWLKTSLAGCGCGCLVLFLVLGAVSARGCIAAKNMAAGFQKAAQTRQQVEGRFGQPGDFVPWADGVVPSDRIETWLLVREESSDARLRLAATVRQLMDRAESIQADQSGWSRFKSVFGAIGDSLGMAGEIGRYLATRNDALFRNDMGHGEYFYLYTVGYYGFLGHTPGEASLDSLGDVEVSTRDGGVTSIQIDDDGRGANPFLQDQLLEMLIHARDAAEEGSAWHGLLVAEIAAMKDDPARMPWGDALPDATRASFEPFRERMAASWVGEVDDFETMRVEEDGDFSFQPAP